MYNAKKDSIGNVREQVLSKCWQFLLVNFDKFSEANKIKIALAIAVKNVPDNENAQTETKIIIVNPQAKDAASNRVENRIEAVSG